MTVLQVGSHVLVFLHLWKKIFKLQKKTYILLFGHVAQPYYNICSLSIYLQIILQMNQLIFLSNNSRNT